MLLHLILFSFCVFGLSLIPVPVLSDNASNAGLTTIDLLTKYGYPSETHAVTTADGYILTMHRIPHGLSGNNSGKGFPIILMPGIFCTSAEWVNIAPDKSLGYLLADTGFDVWMGNTRGNNYSRQHLTINPDTNPEQFFDYSFHEMAHYDIPAVIDYILNITGHKQVNFLGHSQGIAVAYTLVAEKPEYNDKIRLAIGLSPIAYMKNAKNPVNQLVAANHILFEQSAAELNIHEMFPYDPEFQDSRVIVCSSPLRQLCTLALFMFSGFDTPQLDRDTLPTIFTVLPGATSVREYVHWMQLIHSGRYCQYDYGETQNLVKYGQKIPPNYDISKITMPIILHYAKNDLISDPIDVLHFASQLPNLVAAKLVSYDDFSHFDFLYAKDVVTLVYNDVINELLSFDQRLNLNLLKIV